ncbi:hypothetical protein SOVF_164530 [Spinacia oleracea]|nr:hypothetical protein SOVF_164530 [Spinacia oleracea]
MFYAWLAGCTLCVYASQPRCRSEKSGLCLSVPGIIRANSGQRCVVGCHNRVDKERLNIGTQVVIDMTAESL